MACISSEAVKLKQAREMMGSGTCAKWPLEERSLLSPSPEGKHHD